MATVVNANDLELGDVFLTHAGLHGWDTNPRRVTRGYFFANVTGGSYRLLEYERLRSKSLRRGKISLAVPGQQVLKLTPLGSDEAIMALSSLKSGEVATFYRDDMGTVWG